MVYTLVFYTGERRWSGARKLSDVVHINIKAMKYFHEKDVHDLFYLIGAIYNQSVHEKGVLEVKTEIVKRVEQVTDIKWMNEEMVDMCEAERAWEVSKIQQGRNQGIELENRTKSNRHIK